MSGSGMLMFLVLLLLGFIGFVVYFIFKILEFVIVSVNLYKQMVTRQDSMVSLLMQIRDNATQTKMTPTNPTEINPTQAENKKPNTDTKSSKNSGEVKSAVDKGTTVPEQKSERKCNNCGNVLSEQDKTCTSCGKSQCFNCGYAISAQDTTCPVCQKSQE
jgi:RNA polymerase subunit RPABC4/transcription elongation factor Spt4